MAAYFGLFLLPMEKRHSQKDFEPYGNVFFFLIRAALANRQYLDHFTQHGFNSSAVPLGPFWAYY